MAIRRNNCDRANNFTTYITWSRNFTHNSNYNTNRDILIFILTLIHEASFICLHTGILRAKIQLSRQRHLRLPIPNPNLNPKTHPYYNPNPIFTPNPNRFFFERKQKRHRAFGHGWRTGTSEFVLKVFVQFGDWWLAVSHRGLVLGPLLFLIFINDLESQLLSQVLKFADDTKVFGVVNNTADHSRLQNDLDVDPYWVGCEVADEV